MSEQKIVPPSRDPKWQIQISFKEKGRAKFDKEVFTFEIKEGCMIMINHDRYDENGVPHVTCRVYPMSEIRKCKIIEIQRKETPKPSPIISPRTMEPVKSVN